jgi:hypothetical protein
MTYTLQSISATRIYNKVQDERENRIHRWTRIREGGGGEREIHGTSITRHKTKS